MKEPPSTTLRPPNHQLQWSNVLRKSPANRFFLPPFTLLIWRHKLIGNRRRSSTSNCCLCPTTQLVKTRVGGMSGCAKRPLKWEEMHFIMWRAPEEFCSFCCTSPSVLPVAEGFNKDKMSLLGETPSTISSSPDCSS